MDEQARLAALASYNILDTLPDPRADLFVRLAKAAFDVPMALVSLGDANRQWFKACVGVDVSETPRDQAFCAYAILNPREVMVIEDATKDMRFADNPLVTGPLGLRFYAGAPILTPEGLPLGTLCVLDTKPRTLDAAGRQHLADLALGVSSALELHRTAQLLQSSAERERADNLAKSGFLATMSHEIRTPMNAVLGLAGLLLDCELPAEPRRLVEAIHDSGSTLLRILNDILDFTKLEAGQMTFEDTAFSPGSLTHSVTSLLGPQAAAKHLTMDATLDAALPDVVEGDAGRIRQVLLNLASNAVKFTETGAVTLHAAVLRLEGGKATIRWTVTDTGIGIPAGQIGALFSDFVQADASISRRFGGSGLGLAISKRLMTLMGGSIGVESTPGQGTSFHIELTLPVGKPAVAGGAKPGDITPDFNAMLARRDRRLRVLFAEDNPVNQLVARTQLRGFDMHIDMVGDGREAVDAAKRFNYDLIFMDMQMPEMDGLRASRLIRQQGGAVAGVPIIALTANAFATDIKACMDAGMTQFLTKPVSKDLLLRAILTAVGNTAEVKRLPEN